MRRILFFFTLLLSSPIIYAQTITIKGHVYDKQTKEALQFASIGIKNTSLGTTTNMEGAFTLQISEAYKDSILTISFMGYKPYTAPVNDVYHSLDIFLEAEAITLAEIEVRPWEPWDYIKRAMKNVAQNYPNSAYLSDGYFSTLLSENQAYLKYSEAVVQTYSPAYGDTTKSHSRLIQARTVKDPANIKFMRKRFEKRMAKKERKAKKRGEEFERKDIDEELANSSLGNPDMVIYADPVRDTAIFLDEKLHQYFDYSIAGYTSMYDEKVIIIAYESNKKYEHEKHNGKVYISLDSDAILAVQDHTRFYIPDIVRPAAFLLSLGFTDPEMSLIVHYKPINNIWHLNYADLQGNMTLKHKKMFSKNERSRFDLHMSYIVSKITTQNVKPIPKEERMDPEKEFTDQIEEDPAFWNQYQVSRPKGIAQ